MTVEHVNYSDTLRQGTDKINAAINQSNEAMTEASEAKSTADEAKNIANSVQDQLNQVVIEGDSSVEAAQARVGADGQVYATLKERLDTEHSGVIAQLEDNAYYQEVSYEKLHDDLSNTDYYLTTIKHTDSDGNLIKLQRGFPSDTKQTAREFSKDHFSTVVVNASTVVRGTSIYNGEVLQEVPGQPYNYILGIKDDNTLVAYPPNTPSSTIINDGCNNALTAFTPLIQGGVTVDSTILSLQSNYAEPNPRQVIAQYPNKDIVFLTCDGRSIGGTGMTADDVIRILLAKGVQFAFMLDGGGSTQTVVRGIQINRPIDDNGYTEREVADFLHFTKKVDPIKRDKDIGILGNDIGNLKKMVTDLVIDVLNKTDFILGYIRLKGPEGFTLQGIESWEGSNKNTKLYLKADELSYYDYSLAKDIFSVKKDGSLSTLAGTFGTFFANTPTVDDLNNITQSGFYWSNVNITTNSPDTTISWGVIHFKIGTSAMQVAFPFSSNTAYHTKMRRTNPTGWDAWRDF